MTRPSSPSPDTFRTVNIAGQATQSKLNFFLDVVTADGVTGVCFLVYILRVTFVTNLNKIFCNPRKKKFVVRLLLKLVNLRKRDGKGS